MPTKHPDLFAALAAPFEPEEVKVRAQAGRQLHYVTARTVMNRLDDVLGPENWWDEYGPNENSVLCKLSVRLPDGTVLTKADAGGYAGMADSGDDDKSGYSDAFKRAAVKFGVGRYLYRDGVPSYVGDAQERREDKFTAAPGAIVPVASNGNGHANGTQNHDWPGASDPAIAGKATRRESQAPRTGKALFAWTKDQEQRHQVGLLKYLNNWAKLQEFPGRMVDWDPEQVSLAHAEACRKLNAIQASHAEALEDALAN